MWNDLKGTLALAIEEWSDHGPNINSSLGIGSAMPRLINAHARLANRRLWVKATPE